MVNGRSLLKAKLFTQRLKFLRQEAGGSRFRECSESCSPFLELVEILNRHRAVAEGFEAWNNSSTLSLPVLA